MIFEMHQISDLRLTEAYDRIMYELDGFFELNWIENRPRVVIVPDRAAIDAMWQRKTEDWMVGWATWTEAVYMLSAHDYENQCRHAYSEERYLATLKHELAHCFFNVIAGRTNRPVWLKEWVSVFLAGQHLARKRPDQLSTFLDYYDKGDEWVYRESGFAVEFLVNAYWKEKLLVLLKKIKSAPSREEFEILFNSIYGFKPDYDRFPII